MELIDNQIYNYLSVLGIHSCIILELVVEVFLIIF